MATATALLSSASAASRSARSSSARAAALRSERICLRSRVVMTFGGSKRTPPVGRFSRRSSDALAKEAAMMSHTCGDSPRDAAWMSAHTRSMRAAE
eukprot:scaffold87717_cov30-Tisochrysis_lutea.AAC.2